MEDEDQGISAYHGSPHDFEQFDIGKIGTGEGAQAYGRGLYFAEAEPVAKEYRDKLTEGTYKTSTGEIFDPYKDLEHMNVRVAAYKNIENAIERAKGLLKDQPENADKINRDLQKLYAAKEAQAAPHPGHMYEVGIDAHPDHFLDWDKPLDQQPYVMNKLIDAGAIHPNGDLTFMYGETPRHGGEMYERLTSPLSEKVTGGEGQKSASNFLHSIGIKGIKYLDRGSRAAGEGSRNYVVFDDKLVNVKRKYEQGGEVKELLQDKYPTHYMPNVGRQVMADGGETAQPERDVSPLGFYSHAAETAQNFPQAKGTPDQFRSMLLNSGVKPAEIEHSGYDEAFAGKPSVTREDVAQHFSERMPQIEETVLGGRLEDSPDFQSARNLWIERNAARAAEYSGDIDSADDFSSASDDIRDWHLAEAEKTFNEEALGNQYFLDIFASNITTRPKHEYFTLPGGENYKEIALTLPGEEKYRVPKQHSMGDKADINRIAHIRMSDRTGPDGEKILHLEELQSDWGQEGKKKGFASPVDPAIIKKAEDRLSSASDALRNHLTKMGLTPNKVDNTMEIVREGNIPLHRLGGPDNEHFATDYIDAIRAKNKLMRVSKIQSAPYVNSTQGWTDLGLKRVLKEAAEGGYDKVVWTPGVEQAKRYNLADQKGMKGYYDNILPKALQKLVSKHDKDAKVGIKGSLPGKDGDSVPAMGIDITPKMRESIMRGQSAFADGGEVNGYARGGLLTREDTELQRRLKKILREDDVDPERAAEFARVRGTYETPVHERGAYSKRVLPMEAQDVTTNIGPLGNARPKVAPQMSWNDFHKIGKGGTIFTLGGDRSNLGRLTHINGKPLAWSVDLHAGTKYMLEPNEGAVWANDQGAATALRNNILEAAEKGPVYGAFAPMAPTAVDSSVNMFEALMSQIPGAGLSKKDAKKFDDSLKAGEHIKGTGDDAERTRGKRIQELDKWPGILNAEAASDFARTISGAHRAAIVKHMEAAPWQKMGFPSVGITRAAITDPELLSTSGNMMGHHIVELDPSKYDRDRLAFEHSTYPVPTSGKIVGKVPLIERQVAMPDYAEKSVMDPAIHKKGALKGEPLIIHPYSPNPLGRSSWRGNTELRQGIQPINDRMLESIQEVHGSDFADGGEVPPAAGPIQRRQIPVSQSPIVDRALMVSSRSAPTLPGAPFLSRQLRGRPVS